jgi:hypothetical protein
MDIAAELNKLRDYMDNRDTEGFKTYLKALYQKSNAEEKETLTCFVENNLKKSTNKIKHTVSDIQIRIQLGDNAEILPLSYIAKNYFNKTRQWLYQRINGSTVNGRPARFTDSEINTFNLAVQDISKRIGSIAIHS